MNTTHFSNISLSKLFPSDNHNWRITWIGGRLHQRFGLQPEVTVYISRLFPVKNPKGIKPLVAKNLSGLHTEFSARIGYQSLIYIGSVWRNGKNVSNEFKYDEFEKNVDTSKVQTISFNQTDQSGHKILPSYPLGKEAYRNLQDSTLIAIPLNGDPYGLLIPASEIVRFYYLISSSMSQAVYHGLFEKLTDGKVTFDPVEKHVEFTLSNGVSDKNSPIIARYHSSPYMRDRVKEIHQWAQLNSAGKTEVKSSFTFFPFSGKSKLTFQGIEITTEGNQKRILCTSLLKCTAPMSFRTAISRKKEAKPKTEVGVDEPQELASVWPIFSDETDDVINPYEESSKRHVTKTVVEVEERFSSLKYSSIAYRKIMYVSDTVIKVIRDVDATPKEVNTGDGTHGDSNTRMLELEIDVLPEGFVSHIPERLQMFLDVISSLRNEPGWSVDTIRVSLPDKFKSDKTKREVATTKVGIDYLNGLFKISAAKNTWVEIKLGSVIKHRGVIIVEIQYNEKFWYLFDLEADPVTNNEDLEKGSSVLLMFVDEGEKLVNEQLYTFMERCVSNKGWPSSLSEFGAEVKSKRFKHKGELKDRLKKAISGM